jgi:alpha-glucosidase (family GH31 glycosyl hydrolase)
MLTAPLHLIANINNHGWAAGTLFLDDGISKSSIENGDYEYYQFHLSAGSLKKWNKNERSIKNVTRGIDSLTIVNAEAHKSVDFACWVSNDDVSHFMTPIYNTSTKALVLSDPTGPIDTFQLRDMYYGSAATDQNLCPDTYGSDAQFYKIKNGTDYNLHTTAPVLLQLENNRASAHPDLNLTITLTESNMINLRWNYASKPESVKTPYEIPSNIVDIDLKPGHRNISDFVRIQTYIGNTNKGEFRLEISDGADQSTPIFELRSNMQLNQHLNMWEARIHARKDNFQGVMGLADQVSTDLFLGTGTYSVWTRDAPEPVETGKYPTENTYGAHPFIMGAMQDAENSWFGLYSNVANAQDWIIENMEAQGDVIIQMIATGGRGDITIMQAPTPNGVVRTYHNSVVGLPAVTPQWALGWHQSRWGYKDTAFLKQVVEEYTKALLPLDSIWSDIDYMENYRNFEVDPYNFGDLKAFVADISPNVHWVPVVDAGVAQRIRSVAGRMPYLPYNEGESKDIFIKANAFNNASFTGRNWPGDVVYPDFTHPDTDAYWAKWLGDLTNNTGLSGIWLSMNEAASKCDGYCYEDQRPAHEIQRNLKYIPSGRDLQENAIALDAVHHDGSVELDAHSLFGTMEQASTAKFFTDTLKKRPMVISRSSFAGSGKFGGRSLGDNFSQSNYLAYSVTGTMMQNINGIPLSGADICGYYGNTTADLCARWYTVGSFYPFSRNHNHRDSIAQEPYEFNEIMPHYPVKYAYLDIMRWAMWNKMSLIRYYYSEMSHVQRDGGTFFKPLFFDFPNDAEAYQHQVRNVMLGNHLKLGIIPDFGHSGIG